MAYVNCKGKDWWVYLFSPVYIHIEVFLMVCPSLFYFALLQVPLENSNKQDLMKPTQSITNGWREIGLETINLFKNEMKWSTKTVMEM